MITLSDKQPFAQGGFRLVFVHPQDSNKCMKLVKPHREGTKVKIARRFPRNLRSSAHYDDNLREQRGYRYVEEMAAKHDVYRHIPRYYGMEQTDMGAASVSQLMRDYDGSISKSFRQRLQEIGSPERMDKTCADSINELKQFMRETLFLSRKLIPQNILSVRLSENQERLHLIEGFGAPEWIPLVRYIDSMKRKKIERILHAFDERIQFEFDRFGKA